MKIELRFIGLLLLWAGMCFSAQAQDVNLQRAKQLYDFVVAGQGDSIHVRLSDEVRKTVAPAVFSDTFKQLEKQVGAFQKRGKWETDTAGGVTIYYCDIRFKNYALRFLVSFDANGKANTIRFVPVPEVATTSPVKLDKRKLEEREIEVNNGDFKLPGTLTLPKKGHHLPAIILVHGSGPNDRDETLGPNKPFRDIAWGLAEQGVAVIRYDKRTKIYGAASAPVGKELTFDEETVDDALAAVRLAKTLPEVDSGRVYVLGHSQGAMLAPRIAERAGTRQLAGIILLAAPVRKMKELLIEQLTYIASLTASTEDVTAKAEAIMGNLPPAYVKMEAEYQPLEVAQKLTLPIFILQGERDYQVTMQDFGLWRFGLFRNRNVQYKSYPKLNHILQEGSGKSTPFEYNHFGPVPMYVMEDIAAFINQNLK